MLIEALISDSLAKVLGQVVAEKRKEFESIIALKELEFRASLSEMKSTLLLLDRKFENRADSEIERINNVLSSVKDGEKGLQGDDGPQGPQGLKGEKGEVGERGEKGEKGDRGADGFGAIGERGEKGDQGERGEAGAQGASGEKGEQGERGEKGDRGERGEVGEKGETGEQGPKGDRGEKGEPGRDGLAGRDGLQGERGESGKAGRDGVDGRDGKDGLGFDDLQFAYDGERLLEIKFISGDHVKILNINLPIPIYRGRWKEGSYELGDEVTHGGNVYRALKATEEKPPGVDWCIATNRGRDGRDGKDGVQGPQGPEGRPGRDLTQLGPDGKKW